MITAFRQVVGKEGAGALLTGLGPTALGYALQGAFKFGGYEFWKKTAIDYMGIDAARENRQAIYLGASAIAEFFADIALCPLEATRIRLVSQPDFAGGLASGFARIAREEGFAGFYSGYDISFFAICIMADVTLAASGRSCSSKCHTLWPSSPSTRSPSCVTLQFNS